ncbi:hypothetical protein [Dactylosporangium matsuzakiense]|nr:hypothetical protein [Dactylosporangium matsuzakiense]UWZ48021.1 hypothetical protein Dmats_17455 [Dactylosporangium matsuzakiense]
MSGRSYMVAARIPMTRAGFEDWLDTPVPGTGAIADAETVWPRWTPLPGTPRARLTARAAQGWTLARHVGGVLELYLYDYHADAGTTQAELLLLAAAGRRATAETAAMYWGGNGYPDLPFGGDEPIAVLLTGPDGARFTDRYRRPALLAHLRPAETAFLAAIGPHGETWHADGLIDAALHPAG